MEKIIAIYIGIFILNITMTFGQNGLVSLEFLQRTKSKEQIVYSKHRPLKYSDFKGSVPPQTKEENVAAVQSGIAISMNATSLNGKVTALKVELIVMMDASASWMKERGKNEYVLAHEQLHFDITALHACMLANEIQTFTFKDTDDPVQIVNQIHQKYMTLSQEMQTEYDKQTHHGTKTEEQTKWETKIREHSDWKNCFLEMGGDKHIEPESRKG